MKTIFLTLINKFTLGFYLLLLNSAAFSADRALSASRFSPVLIVGGIIAAAAVGGIIAFIDNDDPHELTC